MTAMSAAAVSSLLRSSSIRWAAGGWTFFIAENVILSENRTFLIEKFGDEGYHIAYGTLSTLAVASIAYAYLRKIPRNAPPLLWSSGVVPSPWKVASWTCMSLGLSLASQTLPKLQIPISYVEKPEEKDQQQPAVASTTRQQAPPSGQWKVQCPFDFTDKKSSEDLPRGLDRISRHPGLWAMALTCVGYGCLIPSAPQRVWWSMPVLVAWIGGSHTDSRYRRGMGGSITPKYDGMTSNIPFAALLKQPAGAKDLASELKPLNAALATSIATVWVLRRGKVPKSIMAAAR